ncbi:PE-PGRS family protein [Mycobacterium tuberculosis variant africanum K85]|nr:PE-PGRS family protein [Mycobacterium tuberculosis T46]EFD43443.1 PE-PGRS family protein [Mycobacterium tuberculosis variant africanum K85]EFD47222.1 PE-PGRS family protein [Mycobacterium tuberculosis T17]
MEHRLGRLPAHTLIGTDSPGAEASWVVGITWWSAVVGGFQMSFVIAVPETIAAAATDLADLGSTIAGANAAAAANTTSLLAAGADEISAAIAALFGAHGRAYQAASAEAAAFHGRFVQALTTGGAPMRPPRPPP